MRICGRCDTPLMGRQGKYCSDSCGNKVRTKRHYDNNPEKFQLIRDKYNANYTKAAHARLKCRAKRLGIPFSICVSDIIVPALCPVLCIPLQVNIGKGYHASSPSVDRIVPELGYVKGNIRVISARANLLKNDASELELSAVLMDIRRLQQDGFSL